MSVRLARLTLGCVQSDRCEGGQVVRAACRVIAIRVIAVRLTKFTLCCVQGLRKHVYMQHRKTNKKELEDLTIADMKFTVRFEGGVRLF